MFPELNVYLSGLIPQEATRRIIYSLEVLKTLKGDDIFVVVDNYMMSIDEQDTEKNINLIYDLITNEQISLLKTFGIFVSDEKFENHQHYDLALLLDTLSQIEGYEDPKTLLDIINIHDDVNELLNELTTTLTQTEHFCHYEDILSKVNDGFLLKLVDVLEEKVDEIHLKENGEEEEEKPSYTNLLEKLLAIKDKIGLVSKLSDIEIAQTLLKNPGTLSLSSILRLYGNRLADQENSEWMWILVLYTARIDPETRDPETPEILFQLWGKHFLSEVQQLTMANKVKSLYETLLQQYKHPELEYQL